MPDPSNDLRPPGFISGIVAAFLETRKSVLFIIAALCLGAASIMITPREEEPQIVVPLADVYVQVPGATAEEVEKLVASPLERLLWQIDGVEYVYSVSRRDMALVTVRFYVGENREQSLIKLYNKIYSNQDIAPAVVSGWVIKPVEIDDVSIINLTLSSDRYDDHQLRRIGEEIIYRLADVEDISQTKIYGGRTREVRVEMSPERLAGFNVSALEVSTALAGADASATAGTYDRNNKEFTVTSDSFLMSKDEMAQLVVGVHQGRPVYLSDVADIIDGPAEPTAYVRIGCSGAKRAVCGLPAVTLALSKKKGTNAVSVARDILARMDELKKTVLPDGVNVAVTRNYGQTAQRKVDDLLSSLFFAIVTVVALLAFTLGYREAAIVALAVPVSFSLALFVNHLFGYTINRVTMFALILSLGLVVDDPITNVDNIQRHIRMGRKPPRGATLDAVAEVLPPVIMSTLAIIVSFTPMFFITGMMGPYMAPMAANVPLTVTFSTLCALTIVPWMAYTLLKKRAPKGGAAGQAPSEDVTPAWIHRIYRFLLEPFLNRRSLRWLMVVVIIGGLIGCLALAGLRQVPLKMLPFDNKNEFQILIDLPEGTTLEQTDLVVRDFEQFLARVPEAVNFVSYTGIGSPMDFNGMVRHYYMRDQSNLADIRINLVDKTKRSQQSHGIVLRLRRDLEAIAAKHGAVIKLVEVPPGPPVMSTLTAEIYGPPQAPYSTLIEAARKVQKVLAVEDRVVDLDDSTETDRERLNFIIDKEKAGLHGVPAQRIIQTLTASLSGLTPSSIHLTGERQPLMVRITLPRPERTGAAALSRLPVKAGNGSMVQLAELGRFVKVKTDQPIYHKDLKRLVYVYAELAGMPPANAVIDVKKRLADSDLPPGIKVDWAGEGEWKITVDVFRDLGLAFGAAMIGIYILLVIETASFFMPMLIMLAIPLTLLGIMPGFWLLNIVSAQTIDGFSDPVFFTATSMIGMIALGGIVIRNSLVLIDFIEKARDKGLELKEAVLESGAVRLRPIILTAATTALGAWPITLDPIFSGLAWALIFGLFASTMFTLVVVPTTFYAIYRGKKGKATADGESFVEVEGSD